MQTHTLGKASGRVDSSLEAPRCMHSASRSTDPLNITRAPTPKANLNAHVTALIKMLWRHAAMLTSCIVFLTFLPACYPAIPRHLRPDKRASPLMASPQISRSDLA
jgi:hypothetical protein